MIPESARPFGNWAAHHVANRARNVTLGSRLEMIFNDIVNFLNRTRLSRRKWLARSIMRWGTLDRRVNLCLRSLGGDLRSTAWVDRCSLGGLERRRYIRSGA